MPDYDDVDHVCAIINAVDDPIFSHSDPPQLVWAGEFPAAAGARLIIQSTNPVQDTPREVQRKPIEIAPRRAGKGYLVLCHLVLPQYPFLHILERLSRLRLTQLCE